MNGHGKEMMRRENRKPPAACRRSWPSIREAGKKRPYRLDTEVPNRKRMSHSGTSQTASIYANDNVNCSSLWTLGPFSWYPEKELSLKEYQLQWYLLQGQRKFLSIACHHHSHHRLKMSFSNFYERPYTILPPSPPLPHLWRWHPLFIHKTWKIFLTPYSKPTYNLSPIPVDSCHHSKSKGPLFISLLAFLSPL